MADQPTVTLDGHRVALTNLDKVMYPQIGTTKADVIGYYAAVAGVMVPHVAGRPVTRKRWPDGVDAKPFFEKNLGNGVPSWVPRRGIQHSDRLVSYPLIDSAATMVWLGQSAALELHVPQWFFGPRGARRNPDRLVFDLDPGPGVTLAECAVVARAVREVLGRHGSALYPVTSGSKGLHLYLGLNGSMTSENASEFAHRLAETVEKRLPELVVSRMSKALRPGKVFIDWSQNNGSKTTIAPYSLRGRDHPMVAAPRTWDELDDTSIGQLDYQQVLDRIGEIGDPMAELGHGPEPDGMATLDAVRAAVERAGGQVRVFFSGAREDSSRSRSRSRSSRSRRRLVDGEDQGEGDTEDPDADDDGDLDAHDGDRDEHDGDRDQDDADRDQDDGDRDQDGGEGVDGHAGDSDADDAGDPDLLVTYRSMRRADRTPEPVPDPGIQPHGNDDTFVIQEHHARRLHWDLRLERQGVLVSWAVPRGIPTDAHNRLAVHTEDHPLEYATFSGTIPRGEYGGGDMFIWDAGTYETEKWRDDEVIIVLHGSRAQGRYALIQTDGTNWLLHRMKDQSPEPHDYGPRSGRPARGATTASRGGRQPGAAPKDDAKQPMATPPVIAPMLATPGTVADVDGMGAGAAASPGPKGSKASVASNGSESTEAPGASEGSAGEGVSGGSSGTTAPTTSGGSGGTTVSTTSGGSRGTTALTTSGGNAWRFEAKWDGIRAIATVAAGSVVLRSRAGNDLTASYPELAELAALLPDHAVVLDGEIVALGPAGAPHFGTLQHRMGVTRPRDVAAARLLVEVEYYVFDVLYLDGVSLLRKSYDDRRRLLEAMRLRGDHVSVPEALPGPASRALAESDRRHLEGIVAKRGNSTYDAGKRSPAWLKIKLWRTQDVVIVGWRPGAGRRAGGIGSLLLAVNGSDGLEYAGRVGTGFSDAMLDTLLKRLEPLQRKASPVASTVPAEDARDAVWVRPALVGEVEYSEVTTDHRLRQASWRGLRDDVSVDDVRWEAIAVGR